MLQLLGAVEEEALFRLLDLVVDRDTAGALTFVEELSEQGQDLGRSSPTCSSTSGTSCSCSTWARCPSRCPVTEETRDRLREQANQLGEATCSG